LILMKYQRTDPNWIECYEVGLMMMKGSKVGSRPWPAASNSFWI
jgi:hypothetical protein